MYVTGYDLLDEVERILKSRDEPYPHVKHQWDGKEHTFEAAITKPQPMRLVGVGSSWDEGLTNLLCEVIESEPMEPKKQAPEWISVEDRLPEISPAYGTSDCVLVRAQCLCYVADLGDDGKWRDIHSSDELLYVTHWMPLPDPPEE